MHLHRHHQKEKVAFLLVLNIAAARTYPKFFNKRLVLLAPEGIAGVDSRLVNDFDLVVGRHLVMDMLVDIAGADRYDWAVSGSGVVVLNKHPAMIGQVGAVTIPALDTKL